MTDTAPMAPGPPLCPSAPPTWEDSIVFGIVGGSVDEPRLTYLAEPQPVSEELLAAAQPVNPTEVFRFAAPCATRACQHFDGSRCRLVTRVVELLPAAQEALPRCRLRPNCRWWLQEGKAACRRCPQIVTENHAPTAELIQVAGMRSEEVLPGSTEAHGGEFGQSR